MTRDIGLPHPVSDLADPPIGPDEARVAPTAVCRFHGGRIAEQMTGEDWYGRAYFCPINGGMYWRLTRHMSAFRRPLQFPRGL